MNNSKHFCVFKYRKSEWTETEWKAILKSLGLDRPGYFETVNVDNITLSYEVEQKKQGKTRAEKFFEEFPNARRNAGTGEKYPTILPCTLDKDFNSSKNCSSIDCIDCMREYWDAPAEEEKK